MTAIGTNGRFPPDTASLTSTAGVTTFGTLAWAAWIWGLAIVGNVIAIAALVRWGSMSESLWASAFAGWQQWPMAGAGFTMVVVFVSMLVPNGVTRARIAQAATVTMIALSLFLGAIITLGYSLEARVYDRQSWSHALGSDGASAAEIGYPTVFAAHVLHMALVFAAGWLVAGALFRFGWGGVAPAVVVGLGALAAFEVMVLQVVDLGQLDFLERFSPDGVGVGWLVAIALIVALTAAATRVTRGVDVD